MRALMITFAVSTLLLVGCGQKGPLYLPQDETTADRSFQPVTH